LFDAVLRFGACGTAIELTGAIIMSGDGIVKTYTTGWWQRTWGIYQNMDEQHYRNQH
jgi:hypothetical protein